MPQQWQQHQLAHPLQQTQTQTRVRKTTPRLSPSPKALRLCNLPLSFPLALLKARPRRRQVPFVCPFDMAHDLL